VAPYCSRCGRGEGGVKLAKGEQGNEEPKGKEEIKRRGGCRLRLREK